MAVYVGRLRHTERADIHVRRGARFPLEEGISDLLGLHPFLPVVTVRFPSQEHDHS